jgi:hypothetical protein
VNFLLNHPGLFLVLSLPVFWFSAWLGAWNRKKRIDLDESTRGDLMFVLGSALTLLGLMIAFSFSMAVSRFDQRKNYEVQEANAIGTEYARAGFLPATEAARLRALLKNYLDQRILRYRTRGEEQVREVQARATQLQNEMWAIVTSSAPPPVAALLASGMNDVVNSQRYTQAAWRNHIPIPAWILLIIISIFCNLLIGYVAHGQRSLRLLVLPIALSISLALIADIDSPLGGVIYVSPENLESLAESLHSQ